MAKRYARNRSSTQGQIFKLRPPDPSPPSYYMQYIIPTSYMGNIGSQTIVEGQLGPSWVWKPRPNGKGKFCTATVINYHSPPCSWAFCPLFVRSSVTNWIWWVRIIMLQLNKWKLFAFEANIADFVWFCCKTWLFSFSHATALASTGNLL